MVKPTPAFSYGLFLRTLNVSLRPVLGGDEIVAAAKTVSGPPPYPLLFLCTAGGGVVTAILSALGIVSMGGAPPHSWLAGLWRAELTPGLMSVGASLIPAYFQRSMLVAVTRERVVVARRATFRHRPTHVVVTPVTSARITTGRRTRWTTTILLDTPGTGPLRLNAIKGQRAEIAHVLAVANWAGVPISTSATVSGLVTGTAADVQLPLVARLRRGNGADPDVPR